MGWITVGTQGKSDSIEASLRVDTVDCAPRASNGFTISSAQYAFRVAIEDPGDPRRALGSSVYGDEIQPGPVFNYARIFTWRHIAQNLLNYFETAADNISQQMNLDLSKQNTRALSLQDLNGDVHRMSRYCGIPNTDELAEYPQSGEPGAEFWKQVIGAIIVAVLVQWGTAGPAIMIAYLTGTQGLSCRSGSYLLYAAFSTISFVCFFASVLYSRWALLRVQGQPPMMVMSDGWFRVLGSCAVLSKHLGRVFAILGSFWIIISSMWELVGYYDNCWCNGTVLSWGDSAWVSLFKNVADLRNVAAGPWAGGVFMSAFVMAMSYGIFWLFCPRASVD